MAEFDLAILGAGAAGMMGAVAAGEAARECGKNLRIAVFEKNVRAGIKVLVCGGGRCNFTNAGSVEFLIEQFGRNGRFLTPALRGLDNAGLREFFARRGVPSHEEHDGKIYPDSNQAKSVVDALVRSMRELGVEVFCGAAGTVTGVRKKDVEQTGSGSGPRDSGSGFWIETPGEEKRSAKAVLIAVGGMSYQRMGTTGDGYRFAEGLGHTIVTPRPAIVGLLTQEEWVKELQGLAVQGVAVSLPRGKSAMGNRVSVNDMLFTHFGVSGPAVLNPSESVAEMLETSATVELRIDFSPAHTHEDLHAMMRGWQQRQGKKLLRKILAGRAREIVITSTSPDMTASGEAGAGVREFGLPARLAEKMCELEGIAVTQTCSMLTAAQMHRLVERIKGTRLTVTGTRGFKEAMVTAGGVKLSEVNPKTMESKMCPNLFLAGEVLDLTGPSGGYNLQLAFSTGHLAGREIGERLARVRD